VKPRWEGTAKGIDRASRVASRDEMVAAVARIVSRYRQPALVEHFLEGPEYTVTVIGNDPPRALPVLQRALEVESRIGSHAVETPLAPLPHVVPGVLDAALETRLAALAIRAYDALECRDFARADFKCDAAGALYFLEINPLPTFAPDASFGILAEVMNRTHEDLVAEVLAIGLRRLGIS
jgi:D-alanine-D-alanine ligase